MAVVPRKRKGKVVYGVLTSRGKNRKPHWELVGPNRREAELLDAKRKKEVKAGTFRPGQLTDASSVAAYTGNWLDARKNRSADNDRQLLTKHVLAVKWFAELRMADVRPRHVIKLVDELAGGHLSPKSVSIVMGLVRVMFRDAVIEEVIAATPYVVPRDKLKRRGKKRQPYTTDEVGALCSPAVGERAQIWNILAFFLGARLGEVCGLRWGDWQDGLEPLGAMRIERQYAGQVLKTERARIVPVHPLLRMALAAWKARWSLYHLHAPRPDDLIIPTFEGDPMTRSSAYKQWLRSCRAANVKNRSVHSTRHTFITLTQRGGADRRLVERLTHNPRDEIIDVYTTHEWRQYCEVVLCLDAARASNGASGSGAFGGNGGSEATLDTSRLQDSPALQSMNLVRVQELEPSERLQNARALSGPSNGWWGPLPPPAVAGDFREALHG
jgi:integrase